MIQNMILKAIIIVEAEVGENSISINVYSLEQRWPLQQRGRD